MSFVQGTGQTLAFLATLAGMAQRYSWYIIYMKWAFVIVAAIIGLLAVNLRKYFPDPQDQRQPYEKSRWELFMERVPFRLAFKPIRSVGGFLAGLSISSGVMMLSILLHMLDPYWLPQGTEHASHLAIPHIAAPAISAPGGNLPFGIGGVLKAFAGTITGSLQHAVSGTNAALGGISNAGNAVIDMGLRIRAATIAGQVALQYGLVWLISTILLAIICSIALGLFIARTGNKLFVVWHRVEEFVGWLVQIINVVQELRRQNRELIQTVNYMAELLRHHNLWPADQPLPQLYANEVALPEVDPDTSQQHVWLEEQEYTQPGYGPY